MFFKRKHQKELYDENLFFQNQEKNAINNLYFLKNTYFDIKYYQQNFQYLEHLTSGNYLFNLNKTIKIENIDLISSVIINLLNTLLFVIVIVTNIDNTNIISNYFFIMSINSIFLSNMQNIVKL